MQLLALPTVFLAALSLPRLVLSQSALNLSTPPFPISADATLSEFRINIPDADIEELHAHLKLFRTPRSTYENSQVGWKYGVPKDWLVNATDTWLNNFDWRKQEAILNTVPQYQLSFTNDDGENYTVHFAALFSAKKDAIPIVLSHGWPDLYTIYMPLLRMVQKQYEANPEEMPYHLVVPSLIGTGFSSAPPLTKPFYTNDTAQIVHKLMLNLGFGDAGYIAQGCDVGTMISEYMLEQYDEVKAAHVTLWWGYPTYNATTDLPANSLEEYTLQRMINTTQWGRGNVLIHSDRSSTAGLAIGSNPISTLVWIGERFVLWSNPDAVLSLEAMLTDASIYWFTGTYPTSYWSYAQFRSELTSTVTGEAYVTPPTLTNKPLAFSWFPNEVDNPPKAYFDRNNDIYQYFYRHDKGGHFSPSEVPDVLWADIEDFVAKIWTA